MKLSLVNMPWANVQDPSLGLSILHAVCDVHNIDVTVHYLNQHFLKHVKYETYSLLAEIWAVNDFLFSGILEPEINHEQLSLLIESCEDCYNAIPVWRKRFSNANEALDILLRLRREVIPKYMTECADLVLAEHPSAIGFTCLYDQTIASVALAKLVKDRSDIPIAFGGYSVSGDTAKMLIKSFPFIDIVIEGDGEQALLQWLNSVKQEQSLESVSGANYSNLNDLTNKQVITNKIKKIDLENSPLPNFNDFFDSVETLKTESKIHITNTYLPVESSRGCWWGEKNHCTFCGIDEDTLKYRKKRPESVLKMLATLQSEYGHQARFSFVDYIIPHTYYRTLFPLLIDIEKKYYLTCEVKANIKFAEMKVFAEAGFKEIQPGIESFCSNLLKQMNKGVSSAQNVLTLKLGKIFGIDVHYNILMGFPKEDIADYEQLVKDIPMFCHLDPPMSCVNVLITRNAPLQYNNQRFGYSKPRANRRYNLLFSKDYLKRTQFNLDDYAYIYERPYTLSKQLRRAHKVIRTQVDIWKDKLISGKTALYFSKEGDGLVFSDRRFSLAKEFRLNNMESIVYLSCDLQVMTAKQIAFENNFDVECIELLLSDLCEKRIIFKDENRYIGLAIEQKEDLRGSSKV